MALTNMTSNGTHVLNSNPLTPFKDRFQCTLQTCSVSISLYDYRPSIAVNLLFIVLFSIAGFIHITQLLFWPKTFFSCAIAIGCCLEVVGYITRILGNHNPFSLGPYFVQFIGLTIAPAFFSASIYTTLGEITKSLGPQFSRLRPEIYTKTFVLSDVASLVLQGSGGLATLGLLLAGQDSKSHYGINIMLVGLGYQILSLIAFIYLAGEFAWRLSQWNKINSKTIFSPGHGEGRLQLFLVFFCLSVFCMFARCCYRCAELSGGLEGDLLHDEITFIFLEGMLISISVFSLILGHPGMLPTPKSISLDLEDDGRDLEKNVPEVYVTPPSEALNKHSRSESQEDLIQKGPPLPPKATRRRSGLQTLLSPTPASHVRRYPSPRRRDSHRSSSNWPLNRCAEQRASAHSLTDIYTMYHGKDSGDSEWANSAIASVENPTTKHCKGKNGENVQLICIREGGLANGLTISLGYPNIPTNFV